MIVKILSSASRNFNGVNYNEKKIEKGNGELLSMRNFPSHINPDSTPEEVRNYLKSTLTNSRVKQPQFHAVISTKHREHSVQQLNQIGNRFMDEMGYGKQPYIIVFHSDTDNNHIHIVSSRVDKNTGKKINDNFERLRARAALKKALAELKIKDVKSNHKEIQSLLDYQIKNKTQLEMLLVRQGFKFQYTKTGGIEIFRDGIKQASLSKEELENKFNSEISPERKKQLRAIFYKYKNQCSTTAFKVIDNREKKEWQTEKQDNPKIEWQSEFQQKLLKTFGLEIVFHSKDDKTPFGYSVIDHKSKAVLKGSELMKMAMIFDFSENEIDKKTFVNLTDYNVSNQQEKQILIDFYKNEFGIDVSPEMIWETKTKKPLENFIEIKKDVLSHLSNPKENSAVRIFETNYGKTFVLHTGQHFIGELNSVIGNSQQMPKNKVESIQSVQSGKTNKVNKIFEAMDAALQEIYVPQESELKKKRKSKKTR